MLAVEAEHEVAVDVVNEAVGRCVDGDHMMVSYPWYITIRHHGPIANFVYVVASESRRRALGLCVHGSE